MSIAEFFTGVAFFLIITLFIIAETDHNDNDIW